MYALCLMFGSESLSVNVHALVKQVFFLFAIAVNVHAYNLTNLVPRAISAFKTAVGGQTPGVIILLGLG